MSRAVSEKVKEYRHRWYLANKPRLRAAQDKLRGTPEWKSAQRSRSIKYKYGISAAEYDAVLAGGKCEICGRSDQRLHLDHDHSLSGADSVRGALCFSCNGSLGWYEANVGRIAEYLRPRLRMVK